MGRPFLYHFLRQQFMTLPTLDTFEVDLRGKTVIVVGSNTGLGFETAKHLASMMIDSEGTKGRLILACRSVERGNEALEGIPFFLFRISYLPISISRKDFHGILRLRSLAGRPRNFRLSQGVCK